MAHPALSWKAVTALEAVRFCASRTPDEDRSEELGGERTVYFTDGSALRITVENGAVYTEHTSDPAQLEIEIGVPIA